MPAVPVRRLPFTLTETSVLAVIPARFHSTRLPGKLLADIAGRPMIEHVYRRAQAARLVDAVLVATDDERIADAVAGFGGVACMTSPHHRSGTDRLGEIAVAVPCGLLVGVQGDEPMLDSAVIDAVVAPLRADASLAMGTAARPIADDAELSNPNVVKVVCDAAGMALYFSRAAIPHGRDRSAAAATRAHVGLYVYRRDVVQRLVTLAPGPLEQAEMLEQLRALEHGIGIKVMDTQYQSLGVDTPADLERARQLMFAGARQ